LRDVSFIVMDIFMLIRSVDRRAGHPVW
jgi:hypothetical protein